MKVMIIGTTDILGGAAKVSWELKRTWWKLNNSGSMLIKNIKIYYFSILTIAIIEHCIYNYLYLLK